MATSDWSSMMYDDGSGNARREQFIQHSPGFLNDKRFDDYKVRRRIIMDSWFEDRLKQMPVKTSRGTEAI